jgi:hypothetical protein
MMMMMMMMKTVNASETSVSFYEPTPRNMPEDSHLLLAAVRILNLTKVHSPLNF